MSELAYLNSEHVIQREKRDDTFAAALSDPPPMFAQLAGRANLPAKLAAMLLLATSFMKRRWDGQGLTDRLFDLSMGQTAELLPSIQYKPRAG